MNDDYEELVSVENLFDSWRTYKKGKSRKADVMEFERHLEDNLFSLHEKLKTGNYVHAGYSYFRISDPKKRDIWKAAVRDRIAHQALYAYLCKTYEPLFIDFSFSSRKNKGTRKAVLALSGAAKDLRKNRGKCLAMKCDVRKYFGNIDHKILLSILRKNIADDKIFNLLKIVVESFNKDAGKGIPLGNITSQVFANIYLNELDEFTAGLPDVKYFVRYNDDFIVLERNKERLFADIEKIKLFLKQRLELELPKEKTIFRKLNWGVDFCGCIILPGAVILRQKTKNRILANMVNLRLRREKRKISRSDFAKVADSYFGLLKHVNSYNLKEKIKHNFIYGKHI